MVHVFLRLRVLVALFAAIIMVAALSWAGVSASGSASTDSENGDHPHGSNVARPTVTGPITGGSHGFPFDSSALPLSLYGYSEQEYFVAGTATSYTNVGALGTNGRWTVRPSSSAAYKTRILVRRPTDPSTFNGTVIVEWLNVSVGFDTTPEWAISHNEFMQTGYAWVGVSAQSVGVNGFPPGNPAGTAGALKVWDPVRYGSLVQPGDSFSYDIYSQAGEALRHPRGVQPLQGLKVKHLIATGESQSAFRLVTYIDAVAPVAKLYDGYMVHSRGAGASALSQAPQPDIPAPQPTLFRTDLDVPVIAFQSESDLIVLGYFSDRQPDSAFFRDWETAGTPHADKYHLAFDTDVDSQKALPQSQPSLCDKPINNGPMRYVLNAAYAALNRWVQSGVAAPRAPRIDIIAGAPPTIVRDGFGNAEGGIRTPDVDVPISTLSGLGNSSNCAIFGTTTPFSAAMLAQLYPNSFDYVSKVTTDVLIDVQEGFILPRDAKTIIDTAVHFRLGNDRSGCCGPV